MEIDQDLHVQPNRLERVKLAIQDLIDELQGDRVGLIAFAGRAFLQAPLTIDYDAVIEAVNKELGEALADGRPDPTRGFLAELAHAMRGAAERERERISAEVDASAEAVSPLLATKLYIPPPRPNVVLRPRLIARLNAGERAEDVLAAKALPELAEGSWPLVAIAE